MSKNKLSLQETHSQVADQWHPDKNGDLTPDQVVAGAHRKVWWQCDKGPDHGWNAALKDRTGRGDGCPYCSGRKVSITNSLACQYPEIAKEWHPTKNSDLTPDQVVAGSGRKVWWKCEQGPDHEWEAAPNSRTVQQSGCPWCNVLPRSKIELFLAHEILFFIDFSVDDIDVVVDGQTSKFQVDIKIPNLDLIIEYDGTHWHQGDKSKSRDQNKTELLNQHGWKVIRVRSKEHGKITDDDILLNEADMNTAKTVANHVFYKLSELKYIDEATYRDYESRKDLINSKQAQRYIDELLRKKNVEDLQFEFSFLDEE